MSDSLLLIEQIPIKIIIYKIFPYSTCCCFLGLFKVLVKTSTKGVSACLDNKFRLRAFFNYIKLNVFLFPSFPIPWYGFGAFLRSSRLTDIQMNITTFYRSIMCGTNNSIASNNPDNAFGVPH